MSDFFARAKAAEQDPHNADFAALRQAYMHSDAYRPFKHIRQEKLMRITDSAAGFEDVRQACQNILDANPLDLEARMLLGVAYEQLGEAQRAEQAHTFAERLLDAILATGDGKSLETAFVIAAEAEAWTIMRVFGIRAREGERILQDDRVYEAFKGTLDGEAVTIYFDVTAPAQALDDTLGNNAPYAP